MERSPWTGVLFMVALAVVVSGCSDSEEPVARRRHVAPTRIVARQQPTEPVRAPTPIAESPFPTDFLNRPPMSMWSAPQIDVLIDTEEWRMALHHTFLDTISCVSVVYSMAPKPGSGLPGGIIPGDDAYLEADGERVYPLRVKQLFGVFGDRVAIGSLGFRPPVGTDVKVDLVLPSILVPDGSTLAGPWRLNLLNNELGSRQDPEAAAMREGSEYQEFYIPGVADYGPVHVRYQSPGGFIGPVDTDDADDAIEAESATVSPIPFDAPALPGATMEALPTDPVALDVMSFHNLRVWVDDDPVIRYINYALLADDCSLYSEIMETTE